MNTYYLKTSTIFFVLNFIGLFALCSCAENEVENPHKGAKLPIMQNIADNVPYIQSVDKFPNKYYYAWGFNMFLNVGFKF